MVVVVVVGICYGVVVVVGICDGGGSGGGYL